MKVKDAYLRLILSLTYDYDGNDTVDGLKNLIDEINDLINKALNNDKKTVIYTKGNEKYNILMEKIK